METSEPGHTSDEQSGIPGRAPTLDRAVGDRPVREHWFGCIQRARFVSCGVPARATEPEFYVTAPLVTPLLLGLRVLGVDVERLLREAELTTDVLFDPDARISVQRGITLVRLAVEATSEDLGLRLAWLYEPGSFGVLEHLAQSARNLREAIELLCRYERIHQNGMRTELFVEGERAIVRHTMLHPFPVPRAIVENTLANLLVIGQKLTGVDYAPEEVWFSYAAPLDISEHQRLFRCPLRWNAPNDSLIIAASLLDTPLRHTNPGLASTLERYAIELLSAYSAHRDQLDRPS